MLVSGLAERDGVRDARPMRRLWGSLDSVNLRAILATSTLATVVALGGCSVVPDPSTSEPAPPPPPTAQGGMPLGNVEDPSTLSPEWLAATARYDRCMKEDGWAFRDGPAGAVFGFPEGQAEAFAASEQRCEAESGRQGLAAGAAFTHEELERGHAALLASWQCLTSLGVDLAPPPSLQAFVDDGAVWSPFAELSPAEFDQTAETCPQPR